ncbi:hypothetical protein C1646_667099 [Rhizophagus diaphanus]|nr:hypothetical protein C1646_667099 [Rhizophagus diaphanus] [Rhizophagus sp. MUCL 43196]
MEVKGDLKGDELMSILANPDAKKFVRTVKNIASRQKSIIWNISKQKKLNVVNVGLRNLNNNSNNGNMPLQVSKVKAEGLINSIYFNQKPLDFIIHVIQKFFSLLISNLFALWVSASTFALDPASLGVCLISKGMPKVSSSNHQVSFLEKFVNVSLNR